MTQSGRKGKTTPSDHGLSPDRLEEDFLIDLAQGIQKVLQNDDELFWRNSIRAYTTDQPTLMAFMNLQNEEDDKKPPKEVFFEWFCRNL